MMIIGLGNPGPRYASTRHNAGFLVLDAVADLTQSRFSRVWLRPYLRARWGAHHLVKPLTYMNRSGAILPVLMRRTGSGPGDLLVVYDNVDLPPGAVRMKSKGEGGGGHRGLASIQDAIGTPAFRRIAVGIGRPPTGGRLADYVLEPPSADEREAFQAGVEQAARLVIETAGSPGAGV